METMKTLNLNDGWEDIVNANAMQKASARERVAARKRERKLKKLYLATCVLASIGIVSVILGITGAVAGWLTTFVATVCVTVASFLLGRYVEVKKA